MLILKSLIIVAFIASSSCHAKTEEESIKDMLANVAGATMRQLGNQPKSDCDKQYKGSEAEECKKGYDTKDKMLNKQVSK